MPFFEVSLSFVEYKKIVFNEFSILLSFDFSIIISNVKI